MSGMELNKIVASILVAGIVAMVSGFVANILYKPENPKARGFQIAVTEDSQKSLSPAAEEVLVVKIGQLMASADAAKGKEITSKCTMCHSLDKGGPNKVGPHLWDILDREKAKSEGYSYSAALNALGGKWTYEDLFHFLNNPQKFAKGTKMGFAGLKKPEDIANLLAYLRSLSDAPKPLPAVEK